MGKGGYGWAVWVLGLVAGAWAADPAAPDIFAATGVQAGWAVHLGTTDGQLETALTNGGKVLVHGIALAAAQRDAARDAIRKAGLYGLASVESYGDLTRLPYGANRVNLLVADLDALGAKAPSDAEILRVLVPQYGAAYVKKGSWQKLTKPMPAGADEWTHWWYDASGVNASKDMLAGPPNSLQWIAGDSRILPVGHQGSPNRQATYTGFRIAGGNVVYRNSDDPDYYYKNPEDLVSRDAFNGLPRWKAPAKGENTHNLIAQGNRIFTYMDNGQPVVAMDALTGAVLKTYSQGLAYPGVQTYAFEMLLAGDRLVEVSDSALVVLDTASGAVVWKYLEPDGDLFGAAYDAKDNALFASVYAKPCMNCNGKAWRWPGTNGNKEIVRLDLAGKKVDWKVPFAKNLCQLAFSGNQLAFFNSASIGGNGEQAGIIGALDPRDGHEVWRDTFGSGWNGAGLNMAVWKGMAIDFGWNSVYDLATGAKKVPTSVNQYQQIDIGQNGRCNRMTASGNYLAMGLVNFVDSAWKQVRKGITRSQCATGATPAYGMWYFTPTGCGCISGHIDGYMALGQEAPPPFVPDNQRLQTAAAYLAKEAAPQAARAAAAVPGPVAADWATTNFAYAKDAETPSVNDGDRIYVAVTREHRLEARSNGQVLWSFTAGGRISTAPVLKDGKLYFGSHDGWAYCVNAADGKPQWRFLAAPAEKKIVAYGQVESAWPVYGVTLYNGSHLAVSAGRQAEVDSGIYVYSLGLDGGIEWKTAVNVAAHIPARKGYEFPLLSVRNLVPAFANGKLYLGGAYLDPAKPGAFTLQNVANTDSFTTALRPPTRRGRPESPKLELRLVDGFLSVAAPMAGRQEVEVRAANGARLRQAGGEGPQLYRLPLQGLARGSYVVALRVDGKARESRTVSVP